MLCNNPEGSGSFLTQEGGNSSLPVISYSLFDCLKSILILQVCMAGSSVDYKMLVNVRAMR